MLRSTLASSLLPKRFLFNSAALPRRFSIYSYVMSQNNSSAQAENHDNEIILSSQLGTRFIVLNRPKALNSLSLSMLHQIGESLQKYSASDLCNNIIIKSSNPKFYCAGGDVVTAAKLVEAKDKSVIDYFRTEYAVNHLLATVNKPVIAIISGITMGGGAGISVHAPFRVATETTLFAMPETLIGFFPDVGASFYLPRLDSELGTFLGLTGNRLKGRDVFYAGLATHYVPSDRIPLMEARLRELPSANHEVINAAIEEFVEEPESESGYSFSLAPVMGSIARCFKYDSVEEIMAALSEESENPEWAKSTIETLNQMSPSSLKISLELLRRGRNMTISDCLRMETQLAAKTIFAPDFYEGISELLLKKTKQPKWNPPSLAEISRSQVIERYFLNPVPEAQVEFMNPTDYSEYPFRKFSLPTVEDVRKVVSGEDKSVGDNAMSADEVVSLFVNRYRNKVGVREKVHHIVESNTIKNAKDKDFNTVNWIH